MRTGRCAMFDLDGTLIDSRHDIADAVNAMRSELGLPPIPFEVIGTYVGNGVGKLLERSLEGTGISHDLAMPVMKKHYRAHLNCKTTLYPGVAEGLHRIHNGGWRISLVSNKRTEFCESVLDHFHILRFFDIVCGDSHGRPLKPDPAPLIHVLKETDSIPAESWMLGDSYTDLESGSAAGVKCAYAQYGFGKIRSAHYDLKVASFSEFADYILGANIDLQAKG